MALAGQRWVLTIGSLRLEFMIDTLYIEKMIRNHLRTLTVCNIFPHARKISCQRYSEVFNPKAQNFRLQKTKSCFNSC